MNAMSYLDNIPLEIKSLIVEKSAKYQLRKIVEHINFVCLTNFFKTEERVCMDTELFPDEIKNMEDLVKHQTQKLYECVKSSNFEEYVNCYKQLYDPPSSECFMFDKNHEEAFELCMSYEFKVIEDVFPFIITYHEDVMFDIRSDIFNELVDCIII